MDKDYFLRFGLNYVGNFSFADERRQRHSVKRLPDTANVSVDRASVKRLNQVATHSSRKSKAGSSTSRQTSSVTLPKTPEYLYTLAQSTNLTEQEQSSNTSEASDRQSNFPLTNTTSSSTTTMPDSSNEIQEVSTQPTVTHTAPKPSHKHTHKQSDSFFNLLKPIDSLKPVVTPPMSQQLREIPPSLIADETDTRHHYLTNPENTTYETCGYIYLDDSHKITNSHFKRFYPDMYRKPNAVRELAEQAENSTKERAVPKHRLNSHKMQTNTVPLAGKSVVKVAKELNAPTAPPAPMLPYDSKFFTLQTPFSSRGVPAS